MNSLRNHKKKKKRQKKEKHFLSSTENRLPDFTGGRFSIYFAGMENNEETYSLCALNRIFGFEPKAAHALLSHFGNAAEIFRMTEKELDMVIGPWSKYKGKICPRAVEEAARELESLSSGNISFLGCTEPDYPQLLLDCEDAPVGLYVRSLTPLRELFASKRRIAVVGTRDISPYGQEWCERIVQGLGRVHEKPAIVSGLALGTDICAHIQAVESGMPTIAVMATGPESIYPHRHREFAEKLISTEGCALITDYPPGTAPLAIHFLRRNRIIAGLSDSTVLVESRAKGGGMMTARLAYSYNRDVYALPGRIDDLRSQGCNALIRDKVAEPIDSVERMIADMGFGTVKTEPQTSLSEMLLTLFGEKEGPSVIRELAEVVKIIRRHRGITLDDLTAMTGSNYSRINQLTGMLEMEDVISIDLLQRCTLKIRISR